MATRTISNAGGNWDTTGAWVEGAVPVAGDDVVATATSGSLAINVNTANLGSFDLTGYLGTLSGVGTLNVRGKSNTTTAVLFAGNITWSAPLNLATGQTNPTINLTTNGKLLRSIVYSNNSTIKVVLQDGLTFSNVTTSTGISLSSSARDYSLDLNGQTVSGSSAVKRCIISRTYNSTGGIIRINGGTFANTDFEDCLFDNGGTNLDLSGISGYSGDCGGNAMSGGGVLTLTPSDTQTWNNANGGDWETSTNWTGTTITRVPLPQDDANLGIAYGTSKTVTVATTGRRLCRDISFAGATYTTNLTFSVNSLTIFGSLNFSSLPTSTITASLSVKSQRRSGTASFISNGSSISGSIVFTNYGATVSLDSAITTGSVTISSGIGGLLLNSYTHTLTSTSGFVFTNSTTGTEVNAGTSTIYISNAGTSAKSFAGGGKTYYNLRTPTGTGGVTITGSNSFNNISVDTGAAAKLTITAGTEQTLASFTATGASGQVITLTSSSTATFNWVKSGGGTVSCDWLDISHCVATPANTWYAGANSTNNQGVETAGSGWIFSAPVIYTVTFNKNGGDTDPVPTTKTAYNGFTIDALPTAPTRTGYTFSSWNTAADGSGTAFTASTVVTADITVYAQWTILTYTLTYTAGTGGTIVGTSPQTVNYLGSGTEVIATPSAGYVFDTWDDSVLTAARTDTNVTADINVTASFTSTPPVSVNAYKDENGVNTMIAILNTDSNKIRRLYANPTNNCLYISDGTTGSITTTVNANRDGNDVPVLLACSSDDGYTPVELAVDANGYLLVNSV